MTERFTEPLKQSKEASVTEGEISGSGEVQSRRLESLLIDGNDSGKVNALVGREVVPVVKESKNSPWLILSFFLTLSVTIALALIVFKYYSYSDTNPVQPTFAQEIKQPIPQRPSSQIPVAENQNIENALQVEVVDSVAEEVIGQDREGVLSHVAVAANIEKNLHMVVVGPFINSERLKDAEQTLADLGLQAQQEYGRGMVPMIRLKEGVYSSEKAQKRLDELKKITKSAFLLPLGSKKIVYAGSFSEKERALKLQEQLKQKKVDVELIKTEISMNGTLLIALKADQKTAGQLAQHIKERGLSVQVKESR